MPNKRNKKQGFTLIELLAVIIILVILFVTAIPKFISVRDQALMVKLKTMEGALKTATVLVYTKSYLAGKLSGADTLAFEGNNIDIHSGYPTGFWGSSLRYPINMANVNWTPNGVVCEVEWCVQGNNNVIPSGVSVGAGKVAKLFTRGYHYNQQCGVYFINREDGTQPIIGIESADC